MHDYQRQRILTFLDPGNDPRGTGYHIIQSRIAIGSGELWGKGFREGTQSQLRFLPERHSDFAVAVFGEEWGFVGCVALVTLFCLFLLAIFSTAVQAKDRFGSTLVVGVFFYFFWQIFINMGRVQVPANRYWGAQTQRSLEHFAIGDDRMPLEVCRALCCIKKAAALVNADMGRLPQWKARAIVRAAEEGMTRKRRPGARARRASSGKGNSVMGLKRPILCPSARNWRMALRAMRAMEPKATTTSSASSVSVHSQATSAFMQRFPTHGYQTTGSGGAQGLEVFRGDADMMIP